MNYHLLGILAEDRKVISYRPTLAFMLGDRDAAIFLQQMIYWDSINNNGAFYKFIEPCAHNAYRLGDSWCEELCISPKEARRILSVIGTRVTRDTLETVAEANSRPIWDNQFLYNAQYLILFYTDMDHKTHYYLNHALCNAAILDAYSLYQEYKIQNIPTLTYRPTNNSYFEKCLQVNTKQEDYFPKWTPRYGVLLTDYEEQKESDTSYSISATASNTITHHDAWSQTTTETLHTPGTANVSLCMNDQGSFLSVSTPDTKKPKKHRNRKWSTALAERAADRAARQHGRTVNRRDIGEMISALEALEERPSEEDIDKAIDLAMQRKQGQWYWIKGLVDDIKTYRGWRQQQQGGSGTFKYDIDGMMALYDQMVELGEIEPCTSD